MAVRRPARGQRPRLDDPREPQPLVEPLARRVGVAAVPVAAGRSHQSFLRSRFELGLQGHQLGEGRVRIGLALARRGRCSVEANGPLPRPPSRRSSPRRPVAVRRARAARSPSRRARRLGRPVGAPARLPRGGVAAGPSPAGPPGRSSPPASADRRGRARGRAARPRLAPSRRSPGGRRPRRSSALPAAAPRPLGAAPSRPRAGRGRRVGPTLGMVMAAMRAPDLDQHRLGRRRRASAAASPAPPIGGRRRLGRFGRRSASAAARLSGVRLRGQCGSAPAVGRLSRDGASAGASGVGLGRTLAVGRFGVGAVAGCRSPRCGSGIERSSRPRRASAASARSSAAGSASARLGRVGLDGRSLVGVGAARRVARLGAPASGVGRRSGLAGSAGGVGAASAASSATRSDAVLGAASAASAARSAPPAAAAP